MADNNKMEQLFEQFTRSFTEQLRQTLTSVMQEQFNGLQGCEVPLIQERHDDYQQKPKVILPRFENGDPNE